MSHLISRRINILFMIAGLLILAGCSGRSKPTLLPARTQEALPPVTAAILPTDQEKKITPTPEEIKEDLPTEEEQVIEGMAIHADVISVTASGSTNAFQFSVEISSPDTGCEQYADWWEVLSEDGELIYRRILLHSHVNDQPFIRSGGPVDIVSDEVVIIRAHMNEVGYGGTTMIGSVESGFDVTELPPDFAAGVEYEPPLPTGCNF